MKTQILISALMVAPVAFISAQSNNLQLVQRLKNQPVVRVNGSVLTQGDLLREMFTIFPYARTHNGFPKEMEADIRAGALKMIEFEELLYQEARRRGMTIPAAKMTAALADFRKEFVSQQDYQDYLNSEMNGSQERLRSQVSRSLLIEQMMKLEIYSRTTVTLADAKAYYDKTPAQFRTPESYSVQTISIFPPDKATPAQLKDTAKRAGDALLRAKAARNYNDFGLVAEKFSDDDYRVTMGDHKAVDRAKLPPELMQTILSLQPGQMSGLVTVGTAFCIVRLNSHVPPGMKSFAEVKDALRQELEKNRTEQLRSALNRKLRSAFKVDEL